MQLAGIEIVVGLVGAAGVTRVMNSLLFGVSTTDALTFATVPALLAAVAFAGTVIPAWSATRVDPMVTLREEWRRVSRSYSFRCISALPSVVTSNFTIDTGLGKNGFWKSANGCDVRSSAH
jgi:hypothetical protein